MNEEITPNLHIVESIVKVYTPKGELLCVVDNELSFLDILCQIKNLQLEGYYAVKNEELYPITKSGFVITNGLPSLFSKYEEYMKELMDF